MIKQSFSRRLATTVAINTQFFLSASFGVTAWVIWPQSPQWWGLGIISIALGIASLSCLKTAIAAMIRAYELDRAIADFEAQGPGPKSSHIASRERMKQAGMIDD
ncbi:MAG: hypothetical protein WDN25_13640 [Acetobacteraceae bacterium]